MHYTVGNFKSTVNTFTSSDLTERTSSHFVITQKEAQLEGGQLLQVVPDDKRAWHAGVSAWRDDKNLNSASLGIEHVNQGFSVRYYPFDADQIHTSALMSKEIIKQYGIPPQNILGHEDVSPGRKSDPGPLFPWGKLYTEYGVGAWLNKDEMTREAIIEKYHPRRPYPTNPDPDTLLDILMSYGYRQGSRADIIRAFKRHFSANLNPELSDDPSVSQTDMFWAWALEAKYCS
jgi:N-acetylmuramoyl-L-alanine amidase